MNISTEQDIKFRGTWDVTDESRAVANCGLLWDTCGTEGNGVIDNKSVDLGAQELRKLVHEQLS